MTMRTFLLAHTKAQVHCVLSKSFGGKCVTEKVLCDPGKKHGGYDHMTSGRSAPKRCFQLLPRQGGTKCHLNKPYLSTTVLRDFLPPHTCVILSLVPITIYGQGRNQGNLYMSSPNPTDQHSSLTKHRKPSKVAPAAACLKSHCGGRHMQLAIDRLRTTNMCSLFLWLVYSDGFLKGPFHLPKNVFIACCISASKLGSKRT